MWENIDKILKQRKMSVLQLSKGTNIPPTTIYSWKKGGVTPAANKITIIAEYLNVSVAYLMGATDDPQDYLNSVGEAQKRLEETQTKLEENRKRAAELMKQAEEHEKLAKQYKDIAEALKDGSTLDMFRRIIELSPEQKQILLALITQFDKK